MNRRTLLKSVAAGLATLAVSTRLATASIDIPEIDSSDDWVWYRLSSDGMSSSTWQSKDGDTWELIE